MTRKYEIEDVEFVADFLRDYIEWMQEEQPQATKAIQSMDEAATELELEDDHSPFLKSTYAS